LSIYYKEIDPALLGFGRNSLNDVSDHSLLRESATLSATTVVRGLDTDLN